MLLFQAFVINFFVNKLLLFNADFLQSKIKEMVNEN